MTRIRISVLLPVLAGLCLFTPATFAEADPDTLTTVTADTQVELDQAHLDTILAPVALYPDTLLSHVLVASTYPLEVVQAARWRQDNEDLSEDEVREALEDKEWDPSVKAITPFTNLINTMSDDLDWLQALGDAFLANEEQVLASIQNLRHKAYENGNLADNEYIDVEKDKEEIIIETVRKEVVYVPYYDTRVVYGPWWHHRYPPVYWHHPVHYSWYAGFYWSPSIYISSAFYFGGFHWHNRYVVVNPGYYHKPHHYHPYPPRHHYKVVKSREYQRWSHNTVHRRGVRYEHDVSTVRYSAPRQVKTRELHDNQVRYTGTTQQRVAKSLQTSRTVKGVTAKSTSASKTKGNLSQRSKKIASVPTQPVVKQPVVKSAQQGKTRTRSVSAPTIPRSSVPSVVKAPKTVQQAPRTVKQTAPSSRTVTQPSRSQSYNKGNGSRSYSKTRAPSRSVNTSPRAVRGSTGVKKAK